MTLCSRLVVALQPRDETLPGNQAYGSCPGCFCFAFFSCILQYPPDTTYTPIGCCSESGDSDIHEH